MSDNIDHLAQVIRQVDGDHTLGAGALAEALADAGLLALTEDEKDETIQTLSRLLAEAEEAAIERAAQIERVRDAYNHAHTLITEALEGDTE